MTESFAFSEVARRLNNIVRFGTVSEIDHSKARVRVKIGKIKTGWMPWSSTAGAVKLWNPPVVGEQVSVLSESGDLAKSVAIPSIFRDKFKAPGNDENLIKLELSNKSSVVFDKTKDEITVKIGLAKIAMTPDKISFSVGMSEVEISAEKIKLHSLFIDAPALKVPV